MRRSYIITIGWRVIKNTPNNSTVYIKIFLPLLYANAVNGVIITAVNMVSIIAVAKVLDIIVVVVFMIYYCYVPRSFDIFDLSKLVLFLLLLTKLVYVLEYKMMSRYSFINHSAIFIITRGNELLLENYIVIMS